MNFFHSFLRLSGIYFLASILLAVLSIFTGFSPDFFYGLYITSCGYFISTLVTYIFIRGSKKGGKSFVLHTLSAVSLKFILYLIMIVIYYFLVKKLSPEFVLTFFVIYLTFTSFIIFSFIRQLKTTKQEYIK